MDAPELTTRRQQAHDNSVRGSISDITDFLRSIFGQKLVAHMAGVKDDRRVGKWIKGETPSAPAQERLRAAYKVAWMIVQSDSDEVARAWFIGMNPQLDDEAPATAIAEGRYRDALLAAEAFLAGG